MCRGNWTADEGKALSIDYRPLAATLAQMQVGTMLLGLCTPSRRPNSRCWRKLPSGCAKATACLERYFCAAAQTLSVVAPVGFFVITGSLLPDISVATVRS